MTQNEVELLTIVFTDYVQNCLNKEEDQEDIEKVEELFKKVCNLLDIYDV